MVAAPLVVRTWQRTATQPSGRLAGGRSQGMMLLTRHVRSSSTSTARNASPK